MLQRMGNFIAFVICAGVLWAAGSADEVAKMLFQVITVLLILSVLLFTFGRSRSL